MTHLFVHSILYTFCPYHFLYHYYLTFLQHPIIEHSGNIVNDQGIIFEKDICIGDLSTNEYVDNYVLPSNLLRLVEQEKKQIIPYKELTEVVNLGSKKEKKKSKSEP